MAACRRRRPSLSLSRWFREEKGNKERETKVAAEGEKVGKLGFAERRRGAGFKEGKGRRGAPMAVAEGCRAVLLSAWTQ